MVSDHGRRLVFGDGSIYEGAEAGAFGNKLTLFMKNYVTLAEAASIAFDTQKTSSITYEYGEYHSDYTGYTNVVTLMNDPDEGILITLEKRGD